MRVDLHPAYVLHTRPYRDTSMLVDLFTPEHGRVALVAKGVRTGKSRRRALLNPFTALLVSFQGRGGLKLLTAVEAQGPGLILQGAARSEEHTSELQSRGHLVCRLLLEKKKQDPNRG